MGYTGNVSSQTVAGVINICPKPGLVRSFAGKMKALDVPHELSPFVPVHWLKLPGRIAVDTGTV